MASLPTPHTLLPPLLAHLPLHETPTPPDTLLPHLAPILRSRLAHLSSSEGSYLSLLSWSPSTTSSTSKTDLAQHIKTHDFAPHPTGDFDTSDADLIGVKRVDEETLEALILLRERHLAVRYVFVTSDSEGESPAWKVLDVSVSPADSTTPEGWSTSVWEAEESYAVRRRRETGFGLTSRVVASEAKVEEESEDDDDAYWSRYDQEEGESVPPSPTREGPAEDDYFARYGDVEPAIDNSSGYTPPVNYPGHYSYSPPQEEKEEQRAGLRVFAPVPVSGSGAVAGLERRVDTAAMSPPETEAGSRRESLWEVNQCSGASIKSAKSAGSLRNGGSGSGSVKSEGLEVQMEQGIKGHISSSVKALYRLAVAGGIERAEFERLVTTELGLLGMMEED